MKKWLVSLLALCLMLTLCFSAVAEPLANVAALKGPTAMGLVKMMSDDSESWNFTISAAPDEITPLLIKGELDIAAVPANLASVLYNKTEGKIKVLAINTLGVLYIVENGNSVQSIEDLRGKTIYSAGKGATPEYALNYVLSANGIDPTTDVTIEYKTEHTECLTALLNNEGAVAMLPQPFVTTAKSKAPDIRVALDLNDVWADLQEGNEHQSALLTGVVVARTEFVENNPEAVAAFMDAYAASVTFANENVDETAVLIGAFDIVPEAVAKQALPFCRIVYIDGDEMQDKLSGYLQVLFDQDPAAVGGVLPDEAFYYKR
ncbi:MAG: ABC transporter substrate-binding protein [Clostridiales bacterium]|nr:ABC transporter substrate-binding protein [Clostridiales bacterium]